MIKWIILAIFLLCTLYTHFRGKKRLSLYRQIFNHATLFAPINFFMYIFSKVPNTPFIDTQHFKDLQILDEQWDMIRAEAQNLYEQGGIKAASSNNDVGFNSFFKTGWKRFYLKWYDSAHPSAAELCPQTTALLKTLPSIKAAMFAELAPHSHLNPHRDPYAGSLRYHLGLITPNDERCYIEVDGERYSWRDGQSVVFDETFIHSAENATEQNRIILFCDVERPLTHSWATRFNHWFGRNVMTAASSPNEVGDHTGRINQLYAYAQILRLQVKALKTANRNVYYLLKWVLIIAAVYLMFVRPYLL